MTLAVQSIPTAMFTFSYSECSVHSNWGRIRTRAVNTGCDMGYEADYEGAGVEGVVEQPKNVL